MVTASSVLARLDVMGEAMLLAIFAICCSVLIGFAAHRASPTQKRMKVASESMRSTRSR